MMPGTPSRHAGFTLIELVMFIVIVSAGMAGVLLAFDVTVRASSDPLLQKQAQALAEGVLEEVQTAYFAYCDPTDPQFRTANAIGTCAYGADTFGAAGNGSTTPVDTRPYRSVNHYVSAYATPTALSTVLPGEASISAPAGFSATVTIGPAVLGNITLASGDALLLKVTVTGPANTQAIAEGYKTRQVPQ